MWALQYVLQGQPYGIQARPWNVGQSVVPSTPRPTQAQFRPKLPHLGRRERLHDRLKCLQAVWPFQYITKTNPIHSPLAGHEGPRTPALLANKDKEMKEHVFVGDLLANPNIRSRLQIDKQPGPLTVRKFASQIYGHATQQRGDYSRSKTGA